MASYYFDLTNGSDAAAGTQVAPKKNPSTVTFGANDFCYLRRGTTNTAPAGTQAINIPANGVSVLPYDDADSLPKITCTNVSRGINIGTDISGWRIAGLHIDNVASGTNRRGITNATTGSSESVSVSGTIEDVIITGVVADAANDCNGISLFGAGITIINVSLDDIATDGIWLRSRAFVLKRATVTNVSTDGRGSGDCIQLGGTGTTDFGDFLIRDAWCDHSNADSKQGIICSGATGTGGVIEGCVVIGPAAAAAFVGISPGQDGCIVRNNYVEGGVVAINTPSANTQMLGNFIVQATGRGIDLGSASIVGRTAEDNIIIGGGQTGPGIRHNQGAATGCVIHRNFVSNFTQGIMRVVAATTETENYVSACTNPFVNESAVAISAGTHSKSGGVKLRASGVRQAPTPSRFGIPAIGRYGTILGNWG